MSQILAAFEYRAEAPAPLYDAGHLPLAVSIFADRGHLRAELAEDAAAAGFRVVAAGMVTDLLDGEPRGLGEVILVDVPAPDAGGLAALSRLDLRAAHAGAQVIVSTSLHALDAVFACLDQSSPQLLVEPSRAERVIALGRVLGRLPRGKVRELSNEDRLTLLRLTEQVAQIAEKLDDFGGAAAAEDEGTRGRVGSPTLAYASSRGNAATRQVRAARPPLPDPRLVRGIIRSRQLRGRFLEGDLFADPAWDILLDLTAARAEHARVSVTSLCIASGVPPTTALRWIGQMTEAGLLERVEDESDRRRAFIGLSEKASDAMARYFCELGAERGRLV